MFRPSSPASATGRHDEWELLRRCARTTRDAACSEQVRDLVQGGIDWNRLVALAGKHRVTPLLYWGLSTVCPGAVPPETLALLHRKFTANAARNRMLSIYLFEVLKQLAEQGIRAIPHKGPTLASLAYGSLALRQSGDLDILVPRPDAVKAKHLLMANGFYSYFELTDEQESRTSHHFMLVRDKRPVTVEVHWQLVDDWLCFNLSEKSLLRTASTTRLMGVDVPCIPLPELIIYLCAHGTKHRWERLSWICDIAALCQSGRCIDWDFVIWKARGIGARRMVLLGLSLAADVLGAPLDEAIARGIEADAVARELAREVQERLLRETAIAEDFAEWRRFNVRVRERRRDRLRCRVKLTAGALMPNDRDFAFLKLPPRLSFIYHGVKPVRLASKYAADPTGFLRMVGDLMGSR
jgi:hypothetical protein